MLPAVNRLLSVLIALGLLFGSSATERALAAPHPGKPQAADKPAPAETVSREDADEGEDLEPAAVELDVSGDPPVMAALYHATRETKEKKILETLDDAQKLIDEGSDVKAVDKLNRTALHWAVFGCSYSTKPRVVTAYVNVAESLLEHGVDINHEDEYNDTALDYLLYSPNFEMQTLLLEHGATSGFFVATFNFVQESQTAATTKHLNSLPTAMQPDLGPGLTIPIRLNTPVWSDKSRTGDPVEAVVTTPVMKGMQILLPPGTVINGTVLFASKAPDKYSRPRIVLDFSNVLHGEGRKSPLYARVISVDNARETVRNNEILGIIQPHAGAKTSIAFSMVGAVNPIAGYAVKGIQTAYGLSLRREIFYPEGTDMTIQVTRPSRLKNKPAWAGWPSLPVNAQLQKVVKSAPLRTETSGKTPSDVTNIMFIGSQREVESAFAEAGWEETHDLGLGSAFKTFQATIRQSGYSNAPVSLLMLNGAPPDLVFQKSLNTVAKRHHLRIWKQSETLDGREVWVGAATHDIGLGNGSKGTKWFHRIDPHVDRERERVKNDLLFTGVANGFAFVERPQAPRRARNATGDELITDGKMLVLNMGSLKRELKAVAPPQ